MPGLPDYWNDAVQALSASDSTLARIIAHHPDVFLESRGDAYLTLARSIVGQQISVKAAQTIWDRLSAHLGEVSSKAVLAANRDELQGCGLSSRKVQYLHDLSLHHTAGRLNVENWLDWSDEAIITELTTIRGIGRWTAEMFLIFCLLRPNILPLDDIGLQRAMSMHYNDNEPISKLKMREIASHHWQPYSTVATWYLWRSLDPVPVAY